MQRTRIRTVDTPIGPLTLADESGCGILTGVRFGDENGADESPILLQAEAQLLEYFEGRRRQFTVQFIPKGTAFQWAVWQNVSRIPYGETATYGDIARAVGRPRAFRAVGMANHVNPIPIIIPCHRVMGANGSLTGYAGGLEAKRWLLDLEQKRK